MAGGLGGSEDLLMLSMIGIAAWVMQEKSVMPSYVSAGEGALGSGKAVNWCVTDRAVTSPSGEGLSDPSPGSHAAASATLWFRRRLRDAPLQQMLLKLPQRLQRLRLCRRGSGARSIPTRGGLLRRDAEGALRWRTPRVGPGDVPVPMRGTLRALAAQRQLESHAGNSMALVEFGGGLACEP